MDTRKINSGIFSEMIDKPSGNDKSIQELLQNIPGGIVMYEWDGVKLKTLHISDYFAKLYGSSLVSQGANDGGPDFMHVHPDDVKAFKEAVTNSIHTTQNLQYVYRVWNDAANRYLWTKISTSSKQLEDGKSIIYALYTDVTPEVDAKIEAEKNHEILKASIAASGQFCFELDPTDDHMICSPEQAKLFDLPSDYIKFPESLFAAGGILEEARPVADELMENLHRGVQETECEVRMYTKGDYLWYRFCFTLWDDPRKGYPIYLCSFSNINDQKVAEEKYRQQLEILAQSTSDALAFSKINLTRNICFEGTSQSSRIVSLQKQGHGKLDLSLAETEKFIMDPLEKEQFHKKFSLSKMMEDYQNGVTHIDFQYHFQLDREHIEWVETRIDLVENPSSHDIEGFISARNINAKKMEEMILQRVIDRDYKALIYFDRYQDEYMTFDNQTKQYFVMKNKVYENGVELGISYAAEGEKVHLRKQLTKEKVIQELADNSEYVLFYEGADHHKRYELTLSNVEGDNLLVIGALRDVTDEALLEQLTYESEHDLLTGLYNREKCFAECRKLFEAWPEETFVMVHFDIQRFRLYNSFFGEMEGDRLLRYIADMYRNLFDTHKSGVYGRIEADVFLLCFPYNETVIEKNKKYIREYLQKYREDFKVTGNCGLYVIHDQTLSVEAMFNRATLAAKNNKNKVAHPIQFFIYKRNSYDEKGNARSMRMGKGWT